MRIDSAEALVAELEEYVRRIAYHQSAVNRLSILLSVPDIISELTAEVVKCWIHYSGRGLDDESMIRLAKRMASNRMAELIHRYHGTHRKAELWVEDVEDALVRESPHLSPEGWSDAKERMGEFIALLDDDEYDVVMSILTDDPRVRMWLKVYAMRRAAVYKNPIVQVTPDLIADALHLSRQRARELFSSIRKKWRIVYGQ